MSAMLALMQLLGQQGNTAGGAFSALRVDAWGNPVEAPEVAEMQRQKFQQALDDAKSTMQARVLSTRAEALEDAILRPLLQPEGLSEAQLADVATRLNQLGMAPADMRSVIEALRFGVIKLEDLPQDFGLGSAMPDAMAMGLVPDAKGVSGNKTSAQLEAESLADQEKSDPAGVEAFYLPTSGQVVVPAMEKQGLAVGGGERNSIGQKLPPVQDGLSGEAVAQAALAGQKMPGVTGDHLEGDASSFVAGLTTGKHGAGAGDEHRAQPAIPVQGQAGLSKALAGEGEGVGRGAAFAALYSGDVNADAGLSDELAQAESEFSSAVFNAPKSTASQLAIPGMNPHAAAAAAIARGRTVQGEAVAPSLELSGDVASSEADALLVGGDTLGHTGLWKLDSAAAPSLRPAMLPGAMVPPPSEQIQVHVRRAVARGDDRISIQLEPLELGKVDVQLDIGRDGAARITVLAERQETLDLLQRDARDLARALEQAGLRADGGALEFGLRQQGRSLEDFAGDGRRAPRVDSVDPSSLSLSVTHMGASADGLDIRV